MDNEKLVLNEVRKNLNQLKKLINKQDNQEAAKLEYNEYNKEYLKLVDGKPGSMEVVDLSIAVEETLERFQDNSKWYRRLARMPRKLDEQSDKDSIIHYIYSFLVGLYEYGVGTAQALVDLLPQKTEEDDEK